MTEKASVNASKHAHNFIDLTGQRFGRLLVIELAPGYKKSTHWICKCDCGKIVVVWGQSLRKGNTTSCGCYHREIAGGNFKTHGLSHTKLYHIWEGMKRRCNNESDVGYHKYGARGIRICNEWQNDFKVFYDWAIQNGYEDGLTIDRINNEEGYCPENCRWVTLLEQANNTRSNHRIVCRGEEHTLAEWSRISGIQSATICRRLKKGWPEEEAIFGKLRTNQYR